MKSLCFILVSVLFLLGGKGYPLDKNAFGTDLTPWISSFNFHRDGTDKTQKRREPMSNHEYHKLEVGSQPAPKYTNLAKYAAVSMVLVVISVVVLGISSTAIVFNVKERKKEARLITQMREYTGPFCLNFQQLNLTLQYWTHEPNNVIFNILQWYHTTKLVPENMVTFAFGEVGSTVSAAYTYNTSLTNTTISGILVSGSDGTPSFLVNNPPETATRIIFQGPDNFFNYVLRKIVLNKVYRSETNYNILIAIDGLSSYQIKRNIQFSYTNNESNETCYGFSSVEQRFKVLTGRAVEENVMPVINYMLLGLLVLFVAFRNYQPTRSRIPILPFNTGMLLLLYSVNNFAGLINYYIILYTTRKLERSAYAYVFIHEFLGVFTSVCMLTYTIHICRYYFIKSLYAKLARRIDLSRNRFSVHKKLISNTAFFIASGFVMLVCVAVFVPFQILSQLESMDGDVAHSKRWRFVSYTLVEVIYVIVSIFVILCFTVELALSWRLVVEHKLRAFHYFFIIKDPFYFRLEMLLFIIVLIPIFQVEYVIRTKYHQQLEKVNFFSDTLGNLDYTKEITTAMFKLLVTFFVCGGASLLFQIVKFLASLCSKMQAMNTTELEDFLIDDTGYQLIRDYCEREWSIENIYAWRALYEIKRKGSTSSDRVDEIYNMFIASGSEMELNIPSKTKNLITEKMGPLREKQPTVFFDETMQALYSQVFINISDSMSRLMQTPEFQRYKQSRELLGNHYELK